MINLLDDEEVVVSDAYSSSELHYTASFILECQDFVAHGCPGVAPYDLAVLYFASLADHRELLERRAARLRDADAVGPPPTIH